MKHLLLLLSLVCSFPAQAQRAVVDSTQLLRDIRILAADSMEGRLSGTSGNLRAQQYLEGRFKEIGLQPFGSSYRKHFRLQAGQFVVEQATNLIGYIPGTSSKTIVLTAHYDHLGKHEGKLFNGADDNASGVSALLAVATYFRQHKPNYTLIFAALDGEEQGLQGAEAFLQSPSVVLEQIVLNVNLDMLSISKEQVLYACGSFHYPWLKPLLLQVQPLPNARLQPGHDRPEQGPDDWTNQSDHYAFHKQGVPFIYFGVENHAHYHSDSDVYENINPAFYVDATALVLDFVLIFDARINTLQKQVK